MNSVADMTNMAGTRARGGAGPGGELLREHIAPTVGSPEEVDEEIRQVFAALST